MRCVCVCVCVYVKRTRALGPAEMPNDVHTPLSALSLLIPESRASASSVEVTPRVLKQELHSNLTLPLSGWVSSGCVVCI